MDAELDGELDVDGQRDGVVGADAPADLDAMHDTDDEALSWVGDEEPGVRTRAALAAASGAEPDSGSAPARSGSVLLVLYGVMAGIYVLYTLAWATAVFNDPFSRDWLPAEIMAQLGELLAIAAPAVWMAVTMVLTRARPGARLGWLAAGMLLLFPVPFLLGVR